MKNWLHEIKGFFPWVRKYRTLKESLCDLQKNHETLSRELHILQQKEGEFLAQINVLQPQVEEVSFRPEIKEEPVEIREQILSRAVPSIYINTLPKSGSVYIRDTLMKALNLNHLPLAHGYFPYDVLDADPLAAMQHGGRIAQEHVPPLTINLQLLPSFVPKMILHLRDPRQVLLSWIHFFNRMYKEGHFFTMPRRCPAPDMDYYKWSLDKQIDWTIDHNFPNFIWWIQNWLDALPKIKDFRVLVTTYDDLIKDEEIFFKKILDFYEIPTKKFIQPKVSKDANVNFRSGNPDEWRTVLTAEQQKRCTEQMPDIFFEKFSWKS